MANADYDFTGEIMEQLEFESELNYARIKEAARKRGRDTDFDSKSFIKWFDKQSIHFRQCCEDFSLDTVIKLQDIKGRKKREQAAEELEGDGAKLIVDEGTYRIGYRKGI